jgi:hypothetical protein
MPPSEFHEVPRPVDPVSRSVVLQALMETATTGVSLAIYVPGVFQQWYRKKRVALKRYGYRLHTRGWNGEDKVVTAWTSRIVGKVPRGQRRSTPPIAPAELP